MKMDILMKIENHVTKIDKEMDTMLLLLQMLLTQNPKMDSTRRSFSKNNLPLLPHSAFLSQFLAVSCRVRQFPHGKDAGKLPGSELPFSRDNETLSKRRSDLSPARFK